MCASKPLRSIHVQYVAITKYILLFIQPAEPEFSNDKVCKYDWHPVNYT